MLKPRAGAGEDEAADIVSRYFSNTFSIEVLRKQGCCTVEIPGKCQSGSVTPVRTFWL